MSIIRVKKIIFKSKIRTNIKTKGDKTNNKIDMRYSVHEENNDKLK
ncbi:MAG: hypothetical protein QXG00_00050 [Candidatus Woesearchaeota archaeon]